MTNLFSWLHKVWSSFGEEQTAYAKPEQLVERARCQDQVAIATICEVRENAKKGEALAKDTLAAIIAYAKANPVEAQFNGDVNNQQLRAACFAGDPEQAGPTLLAVASENPNRAIATVANSCDARELAAKINDCLGDEAFYEAFCNPAMALQWMKKMNHDAKHALILGYVLGLATRLQMVRNPSVPLSVFSTQVAKEFGA